MRKLFQHRSYRQLKDDHTERHAPRRIQQKVVIFGPSLTGKTRLANALAGNSKIKTEPTIGASYFKNEKTKNTFLEIWDLGGAERFKALWSLYLRGTNQVVLTFDSANSVSFAQLEKYCKCIKNHAAKAQIVLVGINQKPDEEPQVTDEVIKKFMKKHAIHSYQALEAGEELKAEELYAHLINKAQPVIPKEAEHIVNAKEIAKQSIDFLRDLALNEEGYAQYIQSICNILEDALVSDNINYYMAFNHELLTEQLESLRYAPSSLYSTVYNTIATVLVCCAVISTAFIAAHWMNKILKENYAKTGDYLLFSTSGAKQQAQQAWHDTESITRRQKK